MLSGLCRYRGFSWCAIHSSSPLISFPNCFPLVAEWFEEGDDPEACLDEFSSANHEYEETETSSQGNEVLYTNYTLNSEFPTPLYTHNYLTDFICRHSIDHCRILELGIWRRHDISRHDERPVALDYWHGIWGSKHIYPRKCRPSFQISTLELW